MTSRTLFALIFILGMSQQLLASLPVNSSLTLPSSNVPSFSSLSEGQNNALFYTMLLNDIKKPTYTVRLKVTISGQGISLRTKESYQPRPIYLAYNVPLTLTGADLAEYFHPDNLEFSGISKQAYLINGQLPEGVYSVCIEAYDYQPFQEQAVSNNACAIGLVQEQDPPVILSPVGGLTAISPQHYNITWQSRHISTFPVEYELSIYEYIAGFTPDQILKLTPPVFRTTTMATSYLYGPADPLLREGKNYIILVQARNINRANNVFKNNGFSEFEVFSILSCIPNDHCNDGNPCTSPDIYDDVCNCIGTPLPDTDGDGICDIQDDTPNCAVGFPCDDNDECTINDVYVVNAADECVCEGTASGDSDGDGICDAVDDSPNCAEGLPCDDGDGCTLGDLYVLNSEGGCDCIGVPSGDIDADGVCDYYDICPNGDDNLDFDNDCIPDACDDCVEGAMCDDQNDCTINDTYTILADGSCSCEGEITNDSDNDGICDAIDDNPNCAEGISCDDGNDCTIGDVYMINSEGECECQGILTGDSDGDGICDALDDTPYCPVGKPCDDGNPCTENDVFFLIDGICICQGTIVPVPTVTVSIQSVDSYPFNVVESGEIARFKASVAPEGGGAYPAVTSYNWSLSNNTSTPTITPVGAVAGDGLTQQEIEVAWVNTTDYPAVETVNLDIHFVGGCQLAATAHNIAVKKEVCQVGESCDDGLPCTFNDIYQLDENGNCICSGTDSGDADMDGICDSDDDCPYGDDNIDFDNDNLADACDDCVEGAPCDDNDPTTINDVYVLKVGIPSPPPAWADDPCECIGTPVPCTGDADLDGVCDEDDLCPGSNDLIDTDGDGVPNGCDECEGSIDAIDVDGDGIPDGCDDQMDCEDRAVTLMYTEVEIPQQQCKYCNNLTPLPSSPPSGDYFYDLEDVSISLPDGSTENLSSYPSYFDFPYCTSHLLSCITSGQTYISDFVSSLNTWLSDHGYSGSAVYYQSGGLPCYMAGRTLHILNSDIEFSKMTIRGSVTNTLFEQDFLENNCIDNGSIFVETLAAGLQQPCTNTTYEWNTGATTPAIQISQDIEDYSVTVTCNDNSMTCVYSSDYHNHCIGGFPCDDLDDCTINDTMNELCDCVGEYSGDSDGDGVCDTEDLCPGENDYIDLNGDGIPDCMDCIPGSICDDGNPCTFPDVYDVNCNCFAKYQDEDGDGVCDAEDQCPGFPDYIDVDQDGVPDGCDVFDCLDGSEQYPSCELVKNYCACSGAELIDLRAVSAIYAELFAGIIQLDGSDSDVIISGDETLDEAILYNDEVFQNPYTDAEIAQIIPLGTTSLTDNNNDGIYDQLVDSDGDGVCNLFDICPGNPDFEDIDSDGDGEPDGFRIANDNDGNCLPDNCNDCHPYNNPSLVPDFAMIVMHMFNLECNSNDDCSDGTGILNCDCECETLIVDSDGDGICDEDDDCPGGDNNLDDDNDGIPNGCDPTPCGENISCDDEDDCTIGDVWMLNENGICECTGTTVPDTDNDGTCDPFDLCEGEDDNMDGDNDGVPDGCDLCDNNQYSGNLGDPCDDGDECTILDQLRIFTDAEGNEYCDCAGIWIDSDNDSVCDANDACEGWDDLDDYDNDGEPDGCDPPYYEIGCPQDAYIVHENFPGLIMIFDINDVTEDQLPNPIGIDILVTAGSSQDAILSYNQVAISSFQTVDNQIHVFYGIENLDSEIMQNATNYVTTISYSDHQTCVYDLFKGFLEDLNPNGLGNEMTFECPNEFYTHPENNVFAFNVPFNDQVNISNLPSQIHINCVFSDGSSVNETYDITSVEVQTINIGKVFVLSTSFTPPVNDLSGISGTISFSNGLDCSYSTGNIVVNPGGCYTGQPCDDGDPITHSDTYDVNCNCVGILGHDLDGDGEHDSVDGCPEGSDEDLDGNGVPDLCECPAPVILSTEVVTGNDIKITLEENGEHASYIVVFQGEEDTEPTTLNGPGGTVSTQPIIIPNVATNTNYQISISAICHTGYESASASTQINVPVSEIDFDCGEQSDINSTNTTPLDNLLTGDIVIAGDFSVNVSNITNTCGPGEFTGTGYMEVPYFNSAQVNVTFTCAQIGIADDGSYYLIGGSMVVTGAGIEVISEEVADLLSNIVNTLEDIDDVLGQVEEALGQLELVAEGVNTLDEYFANGHTALTDLISITEQLPYLPENATSTLEEALDCFENLENNEGIDDCKDLYQTGIQELQDAIDELYNADYQVIFKKYEEQAYGFDGKDPDISAHINNYNLLTINEEEYYVAWKSVKTGQNDKVDATLKDGSSLPSTLTFEDHNQQAIPTTIEGNKVTLTIPAGNIHEEVHEVFAVDKDGDEVHLAGKLNVVSYNSKPLTIKIVPVNPQSLSNVSILTAGLQEKLQTIFDQAVVSVDVELLTEGVTVSTFDNVLNEDETGILSNYDPEQKEIIQAFKNEYVLEVGTYYMFLVNDAVSDQLLGAMPFNKGFGFVVLSHHNTADQLARTVAHELGHGAFILQHTFEEYSFDPNLGQGQSNNLMDYGIGTLLRKYQWDRIHTPVSHFGLFDENGESQSSSLFFVPSGMDFVTNTYNIDANPNSPISFLTPSGVAIKSGSISKVYYTSSGYGYVEKFEDSNNKVYVAFYTDPIPSGPRQFRGYIPKDIHDQLAKEDPSAMTSNYSLITSNGGYFSDFTFTEQGEQVKAKGYKPHSDGLNLFETCKCTFTWNNPTKGDDISGSVIPGTGNKVYIPYFDTNLTYSQSCESSSDCPDANELLSGTGEYLYEQLIPYLGANNTQEDLLALANYISIKLKDKDFAFYHYANLFDEDFHGYYYGHGDNEYSQTEILYETFEANPPNITPLSTTIIQYFINNEIFSISAFIGADGLFTCMGCKEEDRKASRDYEIVFSTVNLWSYPSNYNDNSADYTKPFGNGFEKYEYSFADITKRYEIFQQGYPNYFKTVINEFEGNGKAEPISVSDHSNQYVAQFGTSSGVFLWAAFYAEGLSDFTEAGLAYSAIRYGSKLFKAIPDPAKKNWWQKAVSAIRKLFNSRVDNFINQMDNGGVKNFANTLKNNDNVALTHKYADETSDGIETLELRSHRQGGGDNGSYEVVAQIKNIGNQETLIINVSDINNSVTGKETLIKSVHVKSSDGSYLADVKMVELEDGRVFFKKADADALWNRINDYPQLKAYLDNNFNNLQKFDFSNDFAGNSSDVLAKLAKFEENPEGMVNAWEKLHTLLPNNLIHFAKKLDHLRFFENTDVQNTLEWITQNRNNLFTIYPNLTPGEITALSHYTTTEGYQLNFWLRGEPVLPNITWSDEHAIRLRDFMDSAMNKLPPATPPSLSHYFRGVGDVESNILKDLEINETYTPPNYWSASYDEGVSIGFTQNNGGDVLVAIEPANTTAVNITPFSQADFEGELLYKRNSTFTKKNQIPNFDNPGITDVILKQ